MSFDRGKRIQALEAMERQYDLFAFRVDEWSAWRILRNPVHRIVMDLPLSQPSQSSLVRVLAALRATFKLLWLAHAGGRRDLLIKTFRSALRLWDGNHYRDIYFDGLLQRGYSCLKLESANSPDFDRQAAAAWRPADLDPVVFTFWGRVLGWLLPVPASGFCKHISSLLRQNVQVSVDASWLLMRLSTVHWQARLYGALLERTRPKAVLVADTGDYALCIAARRHGIPFIEIQHGVFDAAHPDAIPSWVEGSATELVLPDCLACRGEFWIERLATTRMSPDHAVAVGDEMIDLARQRKSSRSPNRGVHLVLTSQGLDTARLVRWLEEMIACAPRGLDWRLSIKLHPFYDADARAFDTLRGDARVRIIGGAERPDVFELLADADLHLSISSACHFDAAALAVPSVVVPLAGHEAMLDVVDELQFILARNPADVWTLRSQSGVDPDQIYRFAKPSFVDNMQRLLPCPLVS